MNLKSFGDCHPENAIDGFTYLARSPAMLDDLGSSTIHGIQERSNLGGG